MIKFKVDADRLYKNLQETIELTNDLRPLLLKIRGDYGDKKPWTIIGGIQQNFITQGASTGSPWKDLSPDYAKAKATEYPGKTILIRKGILFNSLVSGGTGGVNILTKTRLDYGTIIPYASFHMTGTKRMYVRKPVKTTAAQKRVWKSLITEYVVKTMSGQNQEKK